MRSGSPRWRAPLSFGTPSTTMREEPAPAILAPILLRQGAASAISGSRAARSLTGGARAGAGYLAAHLVGAGGDVGDLGLARRVVDHGGAARERSRHQRGMGAADRH